MRATLTRTLKNDKQTLGQIDAGDVTVYSLELPDLNNDGIEGNEVRKSCVPVGIYRMTKENHRKFGLCYRLHDVPGRSGVLIHSGTHYKHTLGCILPGSDHKDINGDGYLDNVSSKKALSKLTALDITEIEIIEI